MQICGFASITEDFSSEGNLPTCWGQYFLLFPETWLSDQYSSRNTCLAGTADLFPEVSLSKDTNAVKIAK